MNVLYHLTVNLTASSHPFTFSEWTRARATLDAGEVAGASPETFPNGRTVRVALAPDFRPDFRVTSTEIQVVKNVTTLVVWATNESAVLVKVTRRDTLRAFQDRARRAILGEAAKLRKHGFEV